MSQREVIRFGLTDHTGYTYTLCGYRAYLSPLNVTVRVLTSRLLMCNVYMNAVVTQKSYSSKENVCGP
jgi:hypothetical protein